MSSSGGNTLDANPHWQQYAQLQLQAANLVRDAFGDKQQLLQRIEELEAEVSVWRTGHSAAVKERDAAQKVARDYEGGAEPLVVCLIDGDGAIFDRQFVAKGREGGREAAQALMKHVTDYLDSSHGVTSTPKVMCHVWFNKTGLGRVLQVGQPVLFS